MLYIKKILVLILYGISSLVHADFIAFRKLIHPETDKVIYILYDVHATKMFNTLSEDEKREEQETLKEEYNLSLKFKPLSKSITTHHPQGLFPDEVIDNYIKKFRSNYLHNLTKQQKALIKTVKNYNLSLINEDWNNNQTIQSHGGTKYLEAIYKELGLTKKISDNKIVQLGNNSPMRGLTRKFKKHFLQSETSAYSNIDHRTISYTQEEKESKKIDKAIMEALDSLLKNPHHTSVLITAGAEHAANSAASLIKRGYISQAFIISDNLAAKTITNKEIRTIIHALEHNHVFIDPSTNNDIYELIESPLDIKKIFAVHGKKTSDKSEYETISSPSAHHEHSGAAAAAVGPEYASFKSEIDEDL